MSNKLCPFLTRPCDPECMFFVNKPEDDCLIRKSLQEVYEHKTLNRIQILAEGIKREI